MLTVLLVLLCILPELPAQEHFRSILLERACRKRPSLDFCDDVLTNITIIPTVPPVTDATTQTAPPVSFVPELIVPPNPEVVTTESTTVKVSTAPSTTTTKIVSTEGDKTERLGSLLRLPKPRVKGGETTPAPSDMIPTPPPENITESSSMTESENVTEAQNVTKSENATDVVSTTTPAPIEDDKSVLVFVSEYCVIEREHFVKKCHGEIDKSEIPFCKSYPGACASTHGVIPVISYCQRYYAHYPKHCTSDLVADDVMQFCFAFEQFCLPELTPAQAAEKPKSSLKRCEDIVDEARKICNPFPHPKDTFNVLRCSQFLTNCKKFIDWA